MRVVVDYNPAVADERHHRRERALLRASQRRRSLRCQSPVLAKAPDRNREVRGEDPRVERVEHRKPEFRTYLSRDVARFCLEASTHGRRSCVPKSLVGRLEQLVERYGSLIVEVRVPPKQNRDLRQWLGLAFCRTNEVFRLEPCPSHESRERVNIRSLALADSGQRRGAHACFPDASCFQVRARASRALFSAAKKASLSNERSRGVVMTHSCEGSADGADEPSPE